MKERSIAGPGRTNDLAARITWNMLKSSRPRRFILSVILHALDDWSAGGRPWRARLVSVLGRRIERVMAAGSKQDLAADLGRALTGGAGRANARRSGGQPSAPGRHAIEAFIEQADFGEFRELVAGSEEGIIAALEAFNAAIWPYPAKIGCIVAALVDSGNISVKAVDTIAGPIVEKLGPDLMADILLSGLRNSDGKSIAKLSGTLAELIHRLHTGSLLLSRGTRPLFEIYLAGFFDDLLGSLDHETLVKSRVALAEDRESIANAMARATAEHPGLLRAGLTSIAAVVNPRLRAQSLRAGIYEDLDPEELAEDLLAGLADLDTQEIAAIVNAWVGVLNRLHDRQPEIVTRLIAPMTASIDSQALGEVAGWLVPDLIEALEPALEAVGPALVQGIVALLASYEEAAGPAGLQRLRSLLDAEGGSR